MTSVLMKTAPPAEQVPPVPSAIPHNGGRLPQERVQMTRAGLIIPTRLAYDDWAHAGTQLSGIVDSSAWCLGDWLVYGKKHYSDRYQRAIRAAGLQYQTLRNYAWVARRFDLSRRRTRLSFQHHAEVASLPLEEQNKWLDAAEEGMWTTKQLRRRLQEDRSDALPGADHAASLIPRIQVIDSRLRRWRHAAEHAGAQFDSWVVNTLDLAAEEALGGMTVDA